MDFRQFLMNEMVQERDEEFSSPSDAQKALDEFLSQTRDFEVGDYIERNKYGVKRYKFPTGNQVMKVVHIFDQPALSAKTDDENVFNDMIAVCALEKNQFRYFPMDSRYYQKAGSKKNVTFFKRK